MCGAFAEIKRYRSENWCMTSFDMVVQVVLKCRFMILFFLVYRDTLMFTCYNLYGVDVDGVGDFFSFALAEQQPFDSSCSI